MSICSLYKFPYNHIKFLNQKNIQIYNTVKTYELTNKCEYRVVCIKSSKPIKTQTDILLSICPISMRIFTTIRYLKRTLMFSLSVSETNTIKKQKS